MSGTSLDRPTIDVAEAAARLGISTEAVRKRLHRGRVAGFKASNGQWRVYAEAVPPPGYIPAGKPDSVPEGLEDRLASLEDELRRQRVEMARLHTVVEEITQELQAVDVDARIEGKLKPAMSMLLQLVTVLKSRTG